MTVTVDHNSQPSSHRRTASRCTTAKHTQILRDGVEYFFFPYLDAVQNPYLVSTSLGKQRRSVVHKSTAHGAARCYRNYPLCVQIVCSKLAIKTLAFVKTYCVASARADSWRRPDIKFTTASGRIRTGRNRESERKKKECISEGRLRDVVAIGRCGAIAGVETAATNLDSHGAPHLPLSLAPSALR